MKNIFKYASLLAAAVMLVSCHGNSGTEDGATGDKVLEISSDKAFVQTFDDDYATITVTLDGETVTEGVTFYDSKNKPLDITDGKFATDKVGEHKIWANYGSYNSNEISIRAVDVEIPETPADSKPTSTSFKTRILLTEFTTTGCAYCPKMKELLHKVMEDKTTADQVVEVSCHSSLVGNVADPAYVRAEEYEQFAGLTGMPHVFTDMYDASITYLWDVAKVKSLFADMLEVKGDGTGIAVNSTIKDNKLVAKVTVKASETNKYRIGAFLLEDGIYGKQSSATADWMHTHNNVIRYIDAKETGSKNYYGHSLGEIKSGETQDFMFVWDLDEIWETGNRYADMYGNSSWTEFVMENLHMAVFVTTLGKDSKDNEIYYVSNVVDVRNLNGQTKFEYR